MELASWNVNGLRSVHGKDFLSWFKGSMPDVVCLQEIKVSASQLEDDEQLVHPHGYFSHWHFAEKPGYSGVVTYSREEPLAVRAGLGAQEYDSEGRWLEVDFENGVTVINTYWPNSQREHARLPYKLAFCAAAERRLEALRQEGRTVAICGDFNIAHNEIDLANPKSNKDNAGFLPEERAWMEHFVSDLKWIDSFRLFEKGGGHYTWWSYRPGVREKNVGWRLDYWFVNPEARDKVLSASIECDVKGSDHCPIRLTLKD